MQKEKSTRGNAGQFFVAGELCRRGYIAAVTLGNSPNTDILCSNTEGTKAVHIQVKSFVPGNRTCSVGRKAEKPYTEDFFWVLAGIPERDSNSQFVYYVIPADVMARNVHEIHHRWLEEPGRDGRAHVDNKVRAVTLPPYVAPYTNWDISEYENRWDLIERKLGS
ncbi:MAG: hypothetical protein IT326_01255 [Anaerolineae bacterium]|nr:hypothetical protein [Anaerolineae bacterium]